ncbi:MAG: penicillin-binding transpeptidase domain-containing protein [Candidatus Paceibacterota bacterium]|nr:MAG: penicillin-binding transpeptidase domain-containing protein [Candidatus Paceibacterota bacterium]
MISWWSKKIKYWFKRRHNIEITPDEILLDASNLPNFDTDQFEGRLEKPISKKSLKLVFVFFVTISVLLFARTWFLQVQQGEAFLERSENNRLRYTFIFSNRGIIYDRNGQELVFNVRDDTEDFSKRKYLEIPGFSHLLGYVKYPSKDKHGFYWETNYVGKSGVELAFNEILLGENGLKIVETDAFNEIHSQAVTKPPKDGNNVYLSIDAGIQAKLFEIISKTAGTFNYQGGSGAIMNVKTGELIAATSFPEYSSEILSNGKQEEIESYLNDKNNPFLYRLIGGLYAPGSVVKPFLSVAALNEGVIDPKKQILSTDRMAVPNPYVPGQFSYFTDWKAHGWVDMIDALAFSSNIYFYHIGGGFGEQRGLGISKINKYLSDFGIGEITKIKLSGEVSGTIPNPEWKKSRFDDDWRLGDTYNTSIGQYGFQVTPIQILRAVSALANGGNLLTPSLLKGGEGNKDSYSLSLTRESFEITRLGMRRAVEKGTASGLNVPYVSVAAKTGTAEIGRSFIHSWIVGFFPFENPKYAFVVVMERGPYSNTTGGVYVMRQLLDWMNQNTPEYFK